jgi:polysaccharide biosynthesis transport protein
MEGQDTSLHFLDYWRVIRARKEIILAVTLLVTITGAAYTFTLPKIYMAETRIEVRQDALDVDVFTRQNMPMYNPFFLRTEFEVIRSRTILQQVIRDLNLQAEWGKEMMADGSPLRMEDALAVLTGAVRVEQYRDTSLISIRVLRPDPSEAARIANQVAEVYRENRIAQSRRVITSALDALQNEMEKQRALLERAESELEEKREELGVSMMGPSRQGGIQVDKIRLQQLEGDRVGARVDMLVRKARYDQLADLEGDELLSASAYIVNDQALSGLRRQLLDTEVNLSLLRENYGENHPEVLRMVAARDQLQGQVDDALRGLKRGLLADYQVALAKYETISEELDQARAADIAAERERFLPFEKLEREVELQRDIFQSLRARIAQEGIELQVPRTPVDIVDRAEPITRHVSPRFAVNILVSLFLGLAAGIGLAYFIEYLDTSVKTVDDVEQHLGLPVLGIIPQKVRPLIEEGPDSPHAEAYRILRTNLQFGSKGMSGGAYTIVSGGVGEGKSTTLFNLAYVCAQMGEKVLIVDSDLRRPVQHTMLGMQNNFGLTNVLIRDVPIEETIKATSVNNLHFLPSGKLPRSSVGLLDPQRLRELVKNLKTRYDYVFFDSPPIVGVSDASILASEMDGVMLVVQYRKYPRAISARAKRILDNVGANAMGVVLNNINILRDDYYYYYHSYYTHGENMADREVEGGTEALAAAGDRRDTF